MYFINILMLLLPILIAMAFLTLVERKILGYMQLRKGPNIVGPYGILQPFADAMKLFIKEPLRPLATSTTLFIIAPTLSLTLAFSLWIPLPMPHPLVNMNMGVLFILATSSLSVYSILWSGWASNSKYSMFGALRAVAQTISYEVTMAIILLSVLLLNGSFTLQALITTQEPLWLLIPSWPLAMMWYISTLAETNRAPFDLTEGESELVSGFNVEYAAGSFALFFMAEYTNIILMNALSTVVFLGPFTPTTPSAMYHKLHSKDISPHLPVLMNPSILPSIPLWPAYTLIMKKFPTANSSPMHMTHLHTHLHSKHPPLHP
uniref:NADH-ubiquinone oxidoreductase chain 1 n=1 Tax=Allocricetulus eversmanni TaxID=329634 RepID=A0A0U1ZWG9_9RODE|nr:NADH dehydrogenase subunit 1 [Allocricetulus eversmanni]